MNRPHRMRRRSLLLGAVLVLPAAAAAAAARGTMPFEAADATPAAEGTAAITIDNFTFSPAVLTVAAGTRVTWTNRDDIPHTVLGTENPLVLRSPPLDTEDSFAFTFAAPGTYRYFCSLHPHMQGMVMVR
ncbi:cupredoxin domain-containing protein [Dankookia sp. P2]|uniref:cupredoxin domain-containing protein n=1 Tax=Dankookia sp. P2 TaxID=3423955 RepID=UPI003D6644E0